MWLLDVSAPPLCALAIALGHAYEWRSLEHGHFIMGKVRRSWVSHNFGKGMVPVNTLRDHVASSGFFASTALVLAFVLVGVAREAVLECQSSCSKFQVLDIVRKLSLATNVALIFFNFVEAMRYGLYTSFFMNTPPSVVRPLSQQQQQQQEEEHAREPGGAPSSALSLSLSGARSRQPARAESIRIDVQGATFVFLRSARHFALGIRGFYLCVPLGAWMIDTWALIVTTLIYLIFLIHGERIGLTVAGIHDEDKKNEEVKAHDCGGDAEKKPSMHRAVSRDGIPIVLTASEAGAAMPPTEQPPDTDRSDLRQRQPHIDIEMAGETTTATDPSRQQHLELELREPAPAAVTDLT